MAQKSCPIDTHAFSGFGAFQFTKRGSVVQKTAKFWPVKVGTEVDFLQKIALTLEPPKVNYR